MKLVFTGKRQELGNIYSFLFMPVEPLTWIAGQSIRLELPAGYGAEERRFTIASAPYEGIVQITTRVGQSDFKQALAALNPGDHVDAYAIEGNFVWHNVAVPHLFLASGIGITAVHALLKQRIFESQPIKARVLYGARAGEHLFTYEFTQWQQLYPELAISYHAGRLDRVVVESSAPDLAEALVYMSGPQAAVRDLEKSLAIPKERLVSDWFTGRLQAED